VNIIDLFPNLHHAQRLQCDECGSYLDLHFSVYKETISGVKLCIYDLPVLRCVDCSREYLPELTRFAIIEKHREALENHQETVNVKRRKTNKNFHLCTVPFKYDSDDYYYIPGLSREQDDGYLTPVFFNKEVLLKYDESPDYQLVFCSSSYGDIFKNDQYSIPFGLNKNGKVIMWLGDIAELPEHEQFYLLSENIDSDHSVGCEFYDGQIDCIFPELSIEDKLFKARSEFLNSVSKRYGVKISHLDEEVIDLARSLNKPLVDTQRVSRHVADSLNKIYIESFDMDSLKRLVVSLDGNPRELRSLKLLQMLMELISPNEDIRSIMAVFFVLYDFRIANLHISSHSRYQNELSDVKDRLELPLHAGLAEIYNSILVGLTESFCLLTGHINAK